MRKGILLLLALMSVAYYADKANAAFLLEPYAGAYVSSTYDIDGASSGDVTGSALGVKAGFTQMGFSFGLDGQRGNITLDPDSGASSDYTATRLGLFVGYDLPIALRFWGTYIFNLEAVDVDNTDLKYKDGSGTAFGIGYKVIPFVSLNLELANLSTAKFEQASGDTDLDVNYTTYLFSVSLPFSI